MAHHFLVKFKYKNKYEGQRIKKLYYPMCLALLLLILINYFYLLKTHAAPQCSDIYLPGLVSETISPNYQSLFIWNDIQVRRGYVREQIRSNQVQLILIEGAKETVGHQVNYPQYPLHLIESRPLSEKDMNSDYRPDNSSNKKMSLLDYFNDIGRLLYKPFAFTEKYSEFTFHSNKMFIKKQFDQLAFQLQQFDSYLKNLNILPPPQTHIFFETKIKSSFGIGPISFPSKLWSPLRGESYSSIIMRPLSKLDGIVTTPSVIFHERVHTALHYQFGPEAFITKKHSLSLEEGLADFLTSHYLNNSLIGSDFYLIRDIEKTITRMDFKEDSPHFNSVIYSNALWRVRNSIPKDEFNHLLGEFLKQLASQEPNRDLSKENAHPLIIEGENFRFFLGLLGQTFKNNKEASQIINQISKNNLFTTNYLEAHLKNTTPLPLLTQPYLSPLNTLDMTLSTLKEISFPTATAYLFFYFYEDE